MFVSQADRMPRLPRLDLPGVAQHVVQRGNDRRPCFFRDEDYVRYLMELRELGTRFGCHVHAYVLMTNHVHLLVTPECAGAVSRLMQSLGRRYVRYVNDRYHRTGTLWEGRFRSCLVDTEHHVLACYRYIELNPVRAGMTESPVEYRWSSFAGNATAAFDPLLRPHPCYFALGATPAARTAAYAVLVASGLDDSHTDEIRRFTQRQHALGSERFRAAIEAQLGRRAGPAKIGRPRKPTPNESAL